MIQDYKPKEKLKDFTSDHTLEKEITYNNLFGAINNPNDEMATINFYNDDERKDWIKYFMALLIQRYETWGPFFYYPKTYIHYFDKDNTDKKRETKKLLDLRNYDRLIIFDGTENVNELLIINLYNDYILQPGKILSNLHFYGNINKEEEGKKRAKEIIGNNFNTSNHSVLFNSKHSMFIHTEYPTD